jgi:saccharopine dehydrogenase-like NADP-dependent oxidoreductase
LVAKDLLRNGYDVYISDIDDRRVEAVKSMLDIKSIDYEGLFDEAKRKNIDMVCTDIPSTRTPQIVDALIKKGFNVVDVTGFGDIDPRSYIRIAENRGVILSLYNGLAPGLSHILAGRLYESLGAPDSIDIYVGGLPETIYPGIFYTFNPIDYLRQYVEKARHVRNGVTVTIDPLERSGLIDIPKIGLLEYFPTNGLYSLLWSMSDVRDKSEYTLRYPGHLEIMRGLRLLGLLDNETKLSIDDISLTPLEWTARLTGNLVSPDMRDIVILYVIGRREGEVKSYLLIDNYDDESNTSAMARCTGYTQSIVAQLFLENVIDTDIHFPEDIGKDQRIFNILNDRLKDKGIFIN